MQGKKFTPEPGKTYRNKGGGEYLCIRSGNELGENNAEMKNIATTYTLKAVGCCLYQDGTIEWDFSFNGRFERNPH